MTSIAVGLLVILCGLLCAILWRLGDIMQYNRESYKTLVQLKRFSLNPRTRIGGPIHVQSGPVTQEQQLEKLGRASVARRIVIGGDPDSQLHSDLSSTVAKEDSNG